MTVIESILWTFTHQIRTLKRSPRKWYREIKQWRWFWKSYKQYLGMLENPEEAAMKHLYPCLHDATETTQIDPVYFYQDAWVFERIVIEKPEWHLDVGSHHKFVALLSKVIPVTMVDIRPLNLTMESINFKAGSILSLPYKDSSVPSVSSICVVEHIGLGRYGEALDAEGSEKALEELKRIVQVGGCLYLSIPVADNNITAFNAGRMFNLDYLHGLFKPFEILEQQFIIGQNLQDNYQHHARFGSTALFHLRKPAQA